MPVRKTDPVVETAPAPVPPGPNTFEIRVNDKIVFLQRMHTHTIDQQDDHVTIHAVLKLPLEPDPVVEQPNTESVSE